MRVTPAISLRGSWSDMAWVRFAVFLARSPMRSRSEETRIATMISRRSRAIGWRLAMVRIAFSSIWRSRTSILLVVLDHPVGECRVAPRQRVDGIVELLLDEAAHLRQHRLQLREILVIGLDDVVQTCCCLLGLSRSGR